MERLRQLRNKPCLSDVEVSVEGKLLVFRLAIFDERQINVAAGKIHRNVPNGIGKWNFSEAERGALLVLRVPASAVYRLAQVDEAFQNIVK